MTDVFEAFAINLQNLAGPAWNALSKLPSNAAPLTLLIPLPFVAVVLLALTSRYRLRRFRYRTIFRLLVDPRFFWHKSHGLDAVMLAANISVFVVMFSAAIVSIAAVHALVMTGLVAMLGPVTPTTLPPLLVAAIWTIGLWLAFEFAYWLDHYLAHRIPMLWEFHKVHHTAEALSPITNFRVHPIDTIVYYNILAVVKGSALAALTYGFGQATVTFEIWGLMGGIAVVGALLSQMHHTQIWLPLRGWLGHVVLSPAHHQIHHSSDKAHHDRNFGHILAVFDWLAGTLCLPPKKRPKLVFGVDSILAPKHDLHEALVQPFLDAARHLPTAKVVDTVQASGSTSAQRA